MVKEHNSEADEGSSSGMAFLASSMSYMQTGSPLTPISDTEHLPVEKYSPWALMRTGDRLDRRPLRRYSQNNNNVYIPHPQPREIEILLKTYWSAIHPVRSTWCDTYSNRAEYCPRHIALAYTIQTILRRHFYFQNQRRGTYSASLRYVRTCSTASSPWRDPN